MSKLDGDQLGLLNRRMEERWQLEMEEIRSIARRSQDERLQSTLAGPAPEHLEAALAEIAQSADYAIVAQDIRDVRDIEAARARMRAGTYGTCTDCGADIPYLRLQAYPTAKRCVACQRKQEERRLGR